MYCSLCTQSTLACTCNQTDDDANQIESFPAGWQFADTFAPDSIPFTTIVDVAIYDFTDMHGSFAEWTLADAKWYFDHMGCEFVIDGDRSRIFATIRRP